VIFNATFNAQEPISKSTAVKIVQRFKPETGSVKVCVDNLYLLPMMRRVQLFCKALSKRLIHLLKKLLQKMKSANHLCVIFLKSTDFISIKCFRKRPVCPHCDWHTATLDSRYLEAFYSSSAEWLVGNCNVGKRVPFNVEFIKILIRE